MNRKAAIEDFLPFFVAAVFLFIMFLFAQFITLNDNEKAQTNEQYYYDLIGVNTKMVAMLEAPVNRDCSWFTQSVVSEQQLSAINNILRAYGRNPRFDNLDWANLFMRLQLKEKLGEQQVTAPQLFHLEDPLVTHYVAGFQECVVNKKPVVPVLQRVLLETGEAVGKVASFFSGSDVFIPKEKAYFLGVSIPSSDYQKEDWKFEYQIVSEKE